MAKEKLSALDKLVQVAMGLDQQLGLADDPLAKECPTLWDWLSRVRCGNDYIRQPATLSIRLGAEGVIATLTDRDLAVSIDAACRHLSEVFTALERVLTSNAPLVRTWGKREPTLRKRKPKS